MAQVSVVDDVITALLAVITAAVTCPVYDGPPLTARSDTDFVLVGHDGDPAGNDEAAAEVEQDYTTFEAGARDERGAVTCAVISQTGENDFAARRVASRAVMAAIEAALRPGDNLGGVVAEGSIRQVALHQERNSHGAFVRRVFVYSYTAYQG